ncbi:hypothetical protein GF339_05510, partial [candidate division KSB3 bacterium]|nr:hypothetical protein [candidate division KSB3 bacterium]MBD3324020.1 hypothetical protein [candidate division KSB3 bacterium]
MDHEWLTSLNEQLPRYLHALAVEDQPGRFLPCLQNVTPEGRSVALGESCFALKLYYTLRLWDSLPLETRTAWREFLTSFQIQGRWKGDPITHNAFLDPPVVAYLA